MSLPLGEMPRDPVELAKRRAETVSHDSFEHTAEDERMLAELDYAASELGFIGQTYYVDTNRTLIIPASFDEDSRVSYFDLYDGAFEARLVTFARISIGRLIGGTSIRALCLGFSSALLLPFFETTPETDLVFAPVLAVNSMVAVPD
ncbi:hypothetical protein KC930_00530 [Candidatus Saccharibacteria bacterium]|nr:hypothetical protein [Candidatus Saccharibacteria bacterium]